MMISRLQGLFGAGVSCRLIPAACLLLITGCAIQPGQETADDADRDDAEQVIIVDAGIQQVFDQATALMQQEQYENAIMLLDQVVAAEQRLTAPYINLAIAHGRTGNDKLARENLDRALAIDSHDPVANNEKGLMLRKEGKFEEARKAYMAALEKHPDNLPVIRNLGILCDIYLRDWDCALQQYERYQEISPDDKQVEIWIADLKQRAGG